MEIRNCASPGCKGQTTARLCEVCQALKLSRSQISKVRLSERRPVQAKPVEESK